MNFQLPSLTKLSAFQVSNVDEPVLRGGIEIYPAVRENQPDAPCALDLFSGAGGLAVGFRSVGWRIVGASDINSEAGRTFRKNFPEATYFRGPISELSSSDLLSFCNIQRGELDCLIGGPPCQSFSYNNHQRSDQDERSKLFMHYLRIVDALNPKIIVMENVPGILTIGGGSVISSIVSSLSVLGYDASVKVLSAEQFGTPQVRRRVFVVASRVGAITGLLPRPTHNMWPVGNMKRQLSAGELMSCVTVREAIGDLPWIENGGGHRTTGYAAFDSLSAYQMEVRAGSDSVHNHVCHRLTKVNLDRIVHVPQGGNWRNIPRALLPAGMQRANLSDHTKRYGRLHWDGIASTLLTKCDPHWGSYIHPTQDRTISVREAARLQGFPDSFEFHGDLISAQYEQVGNAVPVPVAAAVGRSVAAAL